LKLKNVHVREGTSSSSSFSLFLKNFPPNTANIPTARTLSAISVYVSNPSTLKLQIAPSTAICILLDFAVFNQYETESNIAKQYGQVFLDSTKHWK